MALFTDFFPTGEGGLSSNPGTDQGTGMFTHGAVLANDNTISFTGDTADIDAGVSIGSIAVFTLGADDSAAEFTGVITEFNRNMSGSFVVTIPGTFGAAFASAEIQVSFNGGAETTITGDLNILEDSVLLGDVTHTGNTFDTDAVMIEIGDSTNTTDLDLIGDTIDIGDGTTSTTNITGTVNVGSDGMATNVDGTLTIDEGVTVDSGGVTVTAGGATITAGGLTVSAGGADITGNSTFANNVTVTGDLDLEGTELTLMTNIAQDHSLGLDANGVVRRTHKTDFAGTGVQGSLTNEEFAALSGFVSTWAQGNNTATIPASKIPSIAVAEVHAFTLPDANTTDANGEPSIADIVGYLNSGTPGGTGGVLEGITLSAGDTIIVTGTTEGGTLGDGRSLTYIFTNNTPKLVPASAATTFVVGDFHLLSSSSTVSSLIGGNNINVSSATGDVTVSIDLDNSSAGDILLHSTTGQLDNSNITQDTTTGAISIAAVTSIAGNTSITSTNTFTVGTGQATFGGNVDIASLDVTGNTALTGNLDVDGTTTLDGLTVAEAATFSNNLTVNGDTTTNGDVTINLGDGETVTIDGDNDADGSVDIDVSTTFGSQGDVTFNAATTFNNSSNRFTNGAAITGGSLALATGADRITGAGNINITGDVTGDDFSVGGTLTVTGNATLNGEAITIGDGTDGTTTINGATLQVNAATTISGALTQSGGAVSMNSGSGGITLAGNGLVVNSSNTNINGTTLTVNPTTVNVNSETINIGDGTDGTTTIAGQNLAINATVTGDTLDINSTTLDIDSTTATIDATTISLDATTGDSNFTTTNGNLTLGASGTGELRIEGTGIATATDAEPLALVIGADGHVMTSVTGGGSGGAFDLLIAADSATPGTITAGDLVVLPIITADRNIAFPASPFAGAGFEVSNLSAVGAGSGSFRWSFGQAGDIVMGVTLPAGGFTLDDATASFKFVYTNATYGWVIIGAS